MSTEMLSSDGFLAREARSERLREDILARMRAPCSPAVPRATSTAGPPPKSVC